MATNLTPLQLAREYFPRISPQDADWLLWEMTCYPIGGLSEVRKQLNEHRRVIRPHKRGWLRRFWRESSRIEADLRRALAEIAEAEKGAR